MFEYFTILNNYISQICVRGRQMRYKWNQNTELYISAKFHQDLPMTPQTLPLSV